MPLQHDPQFSTVLVEAGRKAFVSYASYPALRVPLAQDTDEIYLFNCTNEDALYTILEGLSGEFAATVHNHDRPPMSELSLRAPPMASCWSR